MSKVQSGVEIVMSAVIGYWGYGSREEMETLLVKALAPTGLARLTPQPARQPENALHTNDKPVLVAGIAYLEGPNNWRRVSSNNGALTATLSASGLTAAADARIEAQTHGLTLWRDPFGHVPPYWMQRDQVIWFASQIQLLLPMLKKPEVSLPGLYGYACFSYVPTPHTPIANICAVPAASQLTWQTDHARTKLSAPALRRWHEWREAEREISDEDEAVAELRGLLKEAVAEQLADLPSGPVGVFLSGGLDSSITAALLVQAGVEVRAYALDFGQYGLPEWPFAERVAAALKIPLVKVTATPRRIRRALDATARALDAPFGDGVTAPLFLLNEAASRETSVVFNGEGGDQLFAGWTNKPLIASGIYQHLHPAGDDFYRAYLRTFHRLYGYEDAVFSPQLQAEIAALDPLEWLAEALDESHTRSLLDRLRRANLMLKGAQNIQPRATNLATAHGLKVRTPFCHLPLAEWTFQLAGELCLRGPCEKYLLKRAAADWLPPEVVWREKRGMGVPLTSWCLGPLWREIGRWLSPDVLQREGRWQQDVAVRIALGQLSGHLQGRRIGELLWLLLMWQVWRRAVLGEEWKPSFYNPFWLPPRWWQLRGSLNRRF
jgi:asparagine synthase (glutamine-hydrolysing)